MSAVHSVPVVPASALGADAEFFYQHHAHTPVIVRGCYPPSHPLNQLTLDAIGAILGDTPVRVYDPQSSDVMHVPAPRIIDGVRGLAAPHNVVDFYIPNTPLGNLFDVPPFLRHNWFLQPPANCDRYEKSLIVSPAGAYSSWHQDSYGMQGWMYLIEGHKSWRFYAPDDYLAVFDPATRTYRDAPTQSTATLWEGEIRAGDLLYFPSAWPHEVTTHAISFGVGGSVLNDFQIESHMRWWLWERSLDFAGDLDLARVIEHMPAHRFSSPAGRPRAQAAQTHFRAAQQGIPSR